MWAPFRRTQAVLTAMEARHCSVPDVAALNFAGYAGTDGQIQPLQEIVVGVGVCVETLIS